MKFLPAQLAYLLRHRPSQRNIKLLLRFIGVLVLVITLYSVLFHFLMAWEGRYFTWVSGFYWTLTVMSTLGFGDITFESDIGRVFSIVVLLSGIMFLLVLLPFTFIQFFYAPWMEAQSAARAPRELPLSTRGHVILTHYDAVTTALINRLNQYHYPYVLLAPELHEALRLHDLGVQVMLGAVDDPETYRNVRLAQAALVASTASDRVNTNVAFTVQEISQATPIITTADSEASVDILRLAGSAHVLELTEMLGQSLARRTHGGDSFTHIIGQFDPANARLGMEADSHGNQLLIAEATAAGTPLVGRSLQECRLRDMAGVTVVGVWERGRFEVAAPETRISRHTVLVLAGDAVQLKKYDLLFGIFGAAGGPVIIIGGGRVGRATAKALAARKVDYRIVEQDPARIRDTGHYVEGNAAELEVLQRAGIRDTHSVVITTHDDDTNIYLTIYCRRLRPDIQIVSRATLERNVNTLHRAGSDFVMSYASLGASSIFNLLQRSDILMIAEGLNAFKVRVPAALDGRTVADSGIRERTGCSVVAVESEGVMKVNPDPHVPLAEKANIILIGTVEAESQFLRLFISP